VLELGGGITAICVKEAGTAEEPLSANARYWAPGGWLYPTSSEFSPFGEAKLGIAVLFAKEDAGEDGALLVVARADSWNCRGSRSGARSSQVFVVVILASPALILAPQCCSVFEVRAVEAIGRL